MAFLAALFGGGGGNVTKITTDVATTIAMNVGSSTVQGCENSLSTLIGNDIGVYSTGENCKTKIGFSNIKIHTLQMLDMNCMQSASAQMTDSNDISNAIASSLKNVQDGLAKDFNMFSKSERNEINNSVKTMIQTTFTNENLQHCQQD